MPKAIYEDLPISILSITKKPTLQYSGNVENEAQWYERPHKHIKSCEILLVENGFGKTIINEVSHEFCAGDLLIYNEGVEHYEEVHSDVEPVTLCYVVMENAQISGLPVNHLLPSDISPVLHSNDLFPDIQNMLHIIVNECKVRDIGYEVICESMLSALLVKILRIINDEYQILKKGTSKTLELDIKQYIEKNYRKNITLEEISNTFYISQYYLSHLFKNSIGESPILYLTRYRIEKAKELLVSTSNSIKEISIATGYNSTAYFCTIFKRITGVTPTAYREQFLSLPE